MLIGIQTKKEHFEPDEKEKRVPIVVKSPMRYQ